jgi:hypothetical protein
MNDHKPSVLALGSNLTFKVPGIRRIIYPAGPIYTYAISVLGCVFLATVGQLGIPVLWLKRHSDPLKIKLLNSNLC